MSELSELLTFVCLMSPSKIPLGDFSIHVDSSAEFLSLLDCFSITQHVQEHTLDLVSSKGAAPSHLHRLDLVVSNHHVIHLNLSLTSL